MAVVMRARSWRSERAGWAKMVAFNWPHKKKSSGEKSGDFGGQGTAPLGKNFFREEAVKPG